MTPSPLGPPRALGVAVSIAAWDAMAGLALGGRSDDVAVGSGVARLDTRSEHLHSTRGEPTMGGTSWRDLQQGFLDVLDDRQASWLDVWAVLTEHPWFRQMLRKQALRSLPYALAWNDPLVDDLVQHVQMRLLVKIRRDPSLGFDRTRSTFKSWLERIVHNECRDFWRRESRHLLHRESDLPPEMFECQLQDTRLAQRQRERVWRALDRLPQPDQAILKLFASGRTLRQSAETLHLTVYAVRQGRKRALARLRTIWDQLPE